jgi:TetR/AcrR family transcriptional regulator, cholesterol catabolism regulator
MEEQEVDVKNRIVQGAMELIMRYGARSISMDDIARHLSVSKKTLYQHFADKDELVLAVCREDMRCDVKIFTEIRESSSNAIEELSKISIMMKTQMEKINPALLFDLKKFHPKAWNAWLDFKNKFIRESVMRNLKQGMEEGHFRQDINPELMAIVRIELIELLFDQTLFPREKFKLAEVQMHLFDHFVYGLATEKGRKLYEKYKQLNHQPTSVL